MDFDEFEQQFEQVFGGGKNGKWGIWVSMSFDLSLDGWMLEVGGRCPQTFESEQEAVEFIQANRLGAALIRTEYKKRYGDDAEVTWTPRRMTTH